MKVKYDFGFNNFLAKLIYDISDSNACIYNKLIYGQTSEGLSK